jgi:transcriptional regulator with XRE-family HTH domain
LKNIYETVPAAIRFHRKRLGLSFEKAGEICKLNKGVIFEAEAGQRKGKPSLPSIATLDQIARGFGIPIYAFFTEKPEVIREIVKEEHDLEECARRLLAHVTGEQRSAAPRHEKSPGADRFSPAFWEAIAKLGEKDLSGLESAALALARTARPAENAG